jgi:hypothetical protein
MITCDKCGKTGDSLTIGTYNVCLYTDGDTYEEGAIDELNLCEGEDGCHGIVLAELDSMIRAIKAVTPKKP